MPKTVDHPTTFIVYGVDPDKKPHAARFDNGNPELVAKAAELMGFKLHQVNSPAVAAVTDWLPKGRLYANGNGFVPPVRKDIYEQLSATIADATRNAGTEAGSPGLPRNWDEVAPGHLVIAKEGPGWGWYEAIVVKVEGDMLTLHWRDFPWQPDIIQHRSNIALISPGQ
jgi:hypothetical protein